MLTGLQHINLTVGTEGWREKVPDATDPLELADLFYGGCLGLKQDDVPPNMVGKLRWFALGDSGQQIHISLESSSSDASLLMATRPQTRGHPAFTLPYTSLASLEKNLNEFSQKGGKAACGAVNGGSGGGGSFKAPTSGEEVDGFKKGDRFFVRDFAGNRLEFAGI